YELALRTGQDLASALMVFGFALLAPWLWAGAMRFRLSSTRWRGVQLAFTARWKEVYAASWPVFVIAAIWAVFFIAVDQMVAPDMSGPDSPEVASLASCADDSALTCPDPDLESEGEGDETATSGNDFFPRLSGAQAAWLGGGALLALLLGGLAFVRLEFNYRRLLVQRARVGQQFGHWKPVYGDFLRVWLATLGFFLLCLLGVGLVLAAITGGGSLLMDKRSNMGLIALTLLIVFGIFAGLLLLFAVSLPARAYREARMFQLVWNNVGVGQIARFKTSLGTRAFIWLRVKNMLLTLLTLGFYRPFAVASEYAAKVGSVTLHLKGGTDQLVSELVEQQGAFGDAAADALGLDLIG
ncbi:DUF898 family protein, partial [Ottowia sp.]|uniref:DUF898 family protein n=1 Tax=Ottowia sp. TaxID=1898956 RepID=UPI003A8C6746